MTYWYLVAKCGAFALFFGIVTWLRARRPNRTPAETALMWRSAWMTAAISFAGVVIAAAIVIDGDPIRRPALYVVGVLVVAGMLVSIVGAFVHGWAVKRAHRLGPDPDYGDLDDENPPAKSDVSGRIE